jgi:hypothetical protein
MRGNRFCALPKPENVSLTLTQGKWVIEAKIVIVRIFYLEITFLGINPIFSLNQG